MKVNIPNAAPLTLGIALGLAFTVQMIGAEEVLELPLSPSPVGSGARAAGMANAFVAIADDATAASWNPAGIIQLERPEISWTGAFNSIHEDFRMENHPELKSSHSDSNIELNFASIVYPVPKLFFDRNVALSLSYQQKYDLSRKFSAVQHNTTFANERYDFEQNGTLGPIAATIAFELTNKIAFGLSVNFWRDTEFSRNGWKKEFNYGAEVIRRGGAFDPDLEINASTEYKNLRGENFNLGLLYNVTDKLSLGFRYETSLDADVDYSLVINSDDDARDDEEKENRKIRLPATWVFGAAYRFNDKFTLSGDVSTTDWKDFYSVAEDGTKTSFIDGSQNGSVNFDPTWTLRIGAEYVFLPDTLQEELNYLWTLRWGFLFDQEPASGTVPLVGNQNNPVSGNPDEFYGTSIGIGLLAMNRVNVDLSYEFRWGNDVNNDFIEADGIFSEDVRQHRVLLSTVIYF
jgi:long-subunit fatty acid transport protein